MPASRHINPVQKKIDQLNQRAWDRRVHDSPGAFKLSKQSLAMARKIKYRKGIAEAARSMGFCYVRLSKYDEALPLLKESLSLFEALHDLKNQAVVYEYLGVIKRNRGDLGAALTLLFKAVTLSQQTGASENEAIHHYQIGVTYKYLGNFDKALEALFKSISIHKDNKNRHYQSYPIHVIGTIYFETGDYKKALEYFKEGLSIRQQFHDKLGEAGSLDTIGYTLFKVKKFQQALAFCKKALVICKATDDKRSQASTLQHLAEIYAQTGDTKQAIISSNESRRIRKLTGDKRGEAEILLFLAGLSQQDSSKVLGWIKEALKIGIITRSPDIQSKAYHSLYNYHKREGRFKEANRNLEKHYSLEKELQKNSISQKMANLEITRKAEETRKEAELVMNKNEELTRLNRELEVQNALEKVRAVAMGMKKRDDMLDVCTIISLQLESLGVKEIRNVQTAIFYEKRGTYMNYEYYAKHKKTFITETFYTDHKIAKAFAAKMLKGKGEVSFTYIKGEKKVKEWLAYQKKTNVFIDTYLEKATSLNYYWHSLGPVALGISTYVPLTNTDAELFKRFLNVFELAYTRYLDIEKAYAQAREAQVDAAVERVRAKALAMHRSDEVLQVVQSLKREMADLGLTTDITGATIFLEQPDGWVRLWDLTSFDTALTNMDIVFRPDETDPRLYIMRIWESKKDFVVIEQDRKDFLLTIKWIRQFDRKTADEIQGLLRSHKLTHGWHPAARLQHGWLCIDLESAPSEEFEVILPKMAAAFDLAYKRFLDLQKAEAQAKEARIEASLEKVRAQALGMHKPEDLLNVCKVLFKELIQLGFDQLRNAVIHTLYDEKGYFLDHDYSDYSGGAITTIPYSDQPIIKTFLREIRKSSDAFLQVIIKGNELADWKNFRRKTGQRDDPRLKKATVLYYYIYSVGTASIGISAFQPVNEEKLDVLKRFRNVFDFAYRRYMDVAKAEEQAREAQIELGLERVRARAMAMHHSEELAELVTTVFNELNRLGFSLTSSIIWINDHASARNTLWIAGAEMKKPAQPFSITPFHKDFFSSVVHAWKARDPKWVYTLKGAKKKRFENAFLKAIPRLPLPLKKALTVPKQVVFSASFNNFGALEIVETEALDEEKFDILHRFGKVFEQTYTRFLDLQKAEAQAAEARIEASLERVRAAAMSMHKSGQLINVVEAMYNELVSLGFDNIRNAQISIRNLADNTYFVSEYSDYVRLAVKEAPIDNSPLLQRIYSAMERSKDAFYQKEFAGKEYIEWKKWRLQADPNQDPRIFKATSMWFHLYSLGTGYIGISTFGAITPTQTIILKRFRNVFDLAYRRYVDVAKAEVQAREAQIEVAVERVRAKALAMHRSEDLHAVVVTLKNELMGLEIPDVTAATIYLQQDDGSIRILDLTTAREETDDKVELKLDRTFRFEDTDPKLWVRRMWDRKENYFVEIAEKDDFNRVVKWLYTVDPEGAKLAEKIIREKKISRAWLPTVKLEKGILNIDLLEPPTQEIEAILVKMGASFDLAYKRFLDLQKAEAQAREAQIEVALERVRSRSMAMHQTSELQAVIHTVHNELLNLDISIKGGSFVVINKDVGPELRCWGSGGTANTSEEVVVPHFNMPICTNLMKGIKSGPGFFTEEFSNKEKKDYFSKLFKQKPWSDISSEKKKESLTSLDGYTRSVAVSKHTTIFIINHDGHKFTEGENDILKRFGKVFEQTYTRFLDLQKAEAQAREAQIEVSLERVRSRSMAMHKTDELLDAAELVHKELSTLGINSMNVSFAFVDAEEKYASYYSINPVDGKILPIPFVFPHTDTVVMRSILSGWKKQEPLHIVELNERKTREHQTYIGEYIREQLAKSNIPFSVQDFLAVSPKQAVLTTFNFTKGYLFNIGAERLSQTQEELMLRFTRVFEQTYTRFLDLQKAEEQAREAQIEAALEKVRAKVMAMNSSNDLNETSLVFGEQLRRLGIDWQFSYFWLIEEDKDDNTFWITWPDNQTSTTTYSLLEADENFRDCIIAWKNQERIHGTRVPVEQVQGWLDTFERIAADAGGVASEVMQKKNFPEGVFYYDAMIRFGSFGILMNRPTTGEEKNIQARFATEFERAYTRFLDLQKAEAQAKEAEIELALERVRARTMAMQKSDELPETSHILFEQMKELGEPVEQLSIGIVHEENNVIEISATLYGDTLKKIYLHSIDEPYMMTKVYNAWKTQQKTLIVELKGDELNSYNKYRNELTNSEMFPTNLGDENRRFVYAAFFSKGMLALGANEPRPPQSLQLLERFASVFDLTYTRFLDLQKAEAQARESQIELALERVRARTMAMQKSDELRELIQVVYEQFVHLNINIGHAGFVMDYKTRDDYNIWIADPHGAPSQVTIPYFDSIYYNRFNEAKEKGIGFFATHLNFEEKNKFYQTLFKYVQGLPEEAKDFYFNCPGLATSTVLLENIGLYIENFSGIPYTDDENGILMRFGKVFQQTYTRFLDLQKAEAQAREARIEAALEKVRSRTMAMQRSEELGEVATVLFREMNGIVHNLWTCGFVLCEKGRSEDEWWLSAEGGFIPAFYLPNVGDATHANIYEGWLKGESYHTEQLEGKALQEHYDWLMSIPVANKIFEDLKAAGFETPDWQKLHCAYFSKGYLCIITREPSTEEDIFQRFAQVFDLTYTRFLDLQKAEAQAKEAQIEAALERVRSASMAMHASDELQNVIRVLTDQLTVLGFEFHTANFITNASMPDWEIWISSPGSNIPPKLFVPYFDHRLFNERNEAVATGKDMLTVELNAEEKASFLNYFFEHSVAKNTDNDRIKWVKDQPGMALTTVVTKSFSLSVINYFGKCYTDSENELIKRLAHVFEQSYTRFLDLQKAEAQAREAQIETGLERVRSKTMAMHKSEEVTSVAVSLNEELVKLGFEGGSTIIIIDKETGDTEQWTGFSEDKYLKSCYVPYFEHPCHDAILDAWKKGEMFLAYTVAGAEKKSLDDHYFSTGYAIFPENDKKWMREMESVTFSHAFMKYGAIHWGPGHLTEEQSRIIQRFAKVFEQSYTRFLDLQKAEAQAREAEIELALERVRAKTMAMQNSGDLPEAASLLFQQMQDLGMPTWAAGYCTWEKSKNEITLWMSSEGVLQPPFKAPTTEDELFIQMRIGYDEGKSLHVVEMGGKDLAAHYAYMRTLPVVGEIFDTVEEAGHPLPTFQVMHYAYFSKGFLLFITYERVPAAHDIFKRFANVFEQTYTRFLDLQKAEAQAKESQIQLALERVRARTMAMHTSDELGEIVGLMYQQFEELDFGFYQVLVSIYDEKKNHIEWWSRGFGEKALPQCNIIPIIDHPFSNDLLEKWRNKVEYYAHVFEGENKKSWEEYLFTSTDLKNFPEEVKQTMRGIEKVYLSDVFMKYGSLQAGGPAPLPADKAEILKRFAKVLDLAYTRMTDLQKAEEQAREAQIELGLERVRARAMAMQTSEELKGLIGTVFTELIRLDLVLTRCVIMIYNTETFDSKWWMANSEDPDNPNGFLVKAHNHPPMVEYVKAWRERKSRWSYILEGQTKKDWDVFLFSETELKNLPTPVIEGMKAPDRVYLNASFNNFGNLTLASLASLNEEQFDILLRFAKVFDLTYTRFNDLQKAEAQAREATIEASLERIRAKAMAMHHSDELDEVLVVLWEQFDVLGIRPMSAHMTVVDIPNNRFTFRETGKFGNRSFGEQVVNIDAMEIWKEAAEQWRRSEPETLNRLHFPKESLPMVWQVFQQSFSSMPEDSRLTPEDYPDGIYHVAGKHPFGYIGINQVRPSTAEEDQIVIRFASEFGRAYQRFLDLKKAEAQTREAKIEASLERVRSKAMAMHSSEDLAATIGVFYREMESLTFTPRRCGVGLINKETRVAELSTMNSTEEGDSIEIIGKLKMAGHPVLQGVYDNWLNQKEYHPVLRGNEIKEYYSLIRPQIIFPDYSKDTVQFGYFFFFPEGGVYAWTDKELSEEELSIYRRFTSVLSLTYKRYKDLQKAEDQAREAQIEVALERVRSKAMAMHRTDDLNDAVAVVFEELDKLNLGVLRVGISVLNKEQRSGDVWVTSIDKDQAVQVSGDESFDIHPLLHGAFEAWLRQEDFSYVLEGDDLTRYYQAVEAAKFQLPESQMLSSGAEFRRQFCFVAVYNSGGLFAFRETEFPEEAKKVMRRFANVFDLTYKRFLDLQRAEAQAKESQIQLALERVRARTMAMQRSEELAEAAVVLFQQFAALGETPDRISIGIINEDLGFTDVWATDQAGTRVNIHFKARNDESTTIEKIMAEWKAGKKSSIVDLKGEELKSWITYLRSELGMKVDDSYFHGRRIHQVSFFSQGWLNITTLEPLPGETLDLLDRFAEVFNLTYTRFTDLKKAEAQAQKANIEVALERVRARALAMQEPEELIQVAEVLRHEMGALGVEELETCSIYIHDESIHRTECWYALKNAGNNDNKLINDHFSLELEDTWVGREMLNFFRSPNKQVSIVMQGANREEWIRYCENRSVPLRGYYGEVIPDRTYHLYKFSHGAIGAAAAGDISKESWDLLKRTASVFSLAYSRFKDLTQARSDLQNLKEEKLRAEKALEDLQVTQRQLVQSEKMASLGELTAGIAHEIQNPLNFVNNFSEVSNELIDEMVEEVAKGNLDEARAIAEDVKQNLEKINHHGKRADGIVKGMLQHSRSSSGQKEMTDVNALADEYLRLAYHGLRAKDKTFNAKFEANLDQSLPKISIVPQDIGRVILNLITNAFYVVAEKKKKSQNGYEPAVTVSTKNCNDKIEVKVEDNGSGIPSHVLDKIFQPFFTTKPTGQGTGLGLSLSYDIVKAHGGELKVETAENEGSRFFIYLPIE